ncbi:MAG: tungstate ABC transporter substrate-binding protein WtpA [Synergistales bacterium]|nr:tungstate ABC transporter substrate-binding protein WtpA [Synergistales bacterium]
MKCFRKGIVLACAIVILAPMILLAAPSKEIILFHAGSLSTPMAEVESLFESSHPDIDVKREAAGSNALARKIIDLDGKCDLYFSADYIVIENMLRPDYADWNIMFATNELVLMYGPKSKYADQVDADNWYEVIMRKDVSWGNSEPDLDPCGYRSMLVLQLAEKHYGQKGLYERALQHPRHFTRPKAIELVAQVESGALDYAFEYRSVAVQHGLDYVELPPQINLKDVKYADFYKSATIDIAGTEPGTKKTMVGEPIVYGFTIPKQAPNADLAIQFAQFVLDHEGGLAVFEKMGQAIVGPSAVNDNDKIPAELTGFLVK